MMKIRILAGLLVVAGIVALSGRVANASIVLSYALNGDGESRLVRVESALAHAIRLSIQGGDGLFAVLVDDEVSADGSRLPILQIRPINAATADAAIATGAYLTFSFQPGEKSELGLRSLEFDLSKTGGAAKFGCLVQSSLDGFGSGRPALMANPVAAEQSDKLHYSVDLTGERFQDLGAVDFRVYFYSGESDQPLEFDGIRLNGEVLVAPEPDSSLVWLLMLAALLFVAVTGWTARRNRAAWAHAAIGRGPATTIRREPWSGQTRAAILDIIEGRRFE